jgi:hypothetical protein
MAVVTFYEKPGCKGNLRQKTLLAAAGHTVQAKSLKTEAWTADRLLAFLGKLPISAWFNPAAPDIKAGEIVPENLGFVRGMNAGIAAARPEDDVVLLNNDLVITQRDWLNRLRDAAYARPEYGVIGCRMHGGEGDQRLFHLGGFIEPESLWGQQTESGIQEVEAGQFTRTRRVQGIAFAVAYIRRDCLTRVGPLDEIFHSYFEDTDYACVPPCRHRQRGRRCRHPAPRSTWLDARRRQFRERLWKQSRAAFAR